MGLFELFELCAIAAQPPADTGASQAAPPPGFGAEDFRSLRARLLWPGLVSAVLVCLGLLQGFAAS
jgi:hypothetical protein